MAVVASLAKDPSEIVMVLFLLVRRAARWQAAGTSATRTATAARSSRVATSSA